MVIQSNPIALQEQFPKAANLAIDTATSVMKHSSFSPPQLPS